MQVAVSKDFDFDFDGVRTSPYLSAPSSPKRFGEYYTSAPTSPSRLSQFYAEFDYLSTIDAVSASSSTPSAAWEWEHKPSTINKHSRHDDADDGFAFHVSLESPKSSRSAEELFHGGKIKPLKPPSRLEVNEFASPKSPLLSPRQSRSPLAQGKKVIRDAFSPKKETQERRGRDTTPAAMSSSNSGRRSTRSHSPYRNSDDTWDDEQHPQQQISKEESSTSSSKSSRKWRLRDFLLFRSASEGRASNKDPLRKYFVLNKKPEEAKNSSFRSIDSPTSAVVSRRRGPISAHEFHYALKKAESEDLKKKTFLPYKQGILGRLAGLGSLTR